MLISNYENYEYLNTILDLNDKSKVLGEIYVITNTEDNTRYVGQTVTHRKNKNKYRPFGSQGRFNDHISEAINNTKKNQCNYLNNAIRKYGKECFTVEIIERCKVDELDEWEQFWIKVYRSIYPNGYNLTVGGKNISKIETIPSTPSLNSVKKRGRGFGYTHKESTRLKMSNRLKEICKTSEIKNRMSNEMIKYYDENKIKILSKYKLDDDIEKYIKPVCKKDTKIIHNYIIKINKRKLTLYSSGTLDEKYNRLKNILIKARDANKK